MCDLQMTACENGYISLAGFVIFLVVLVGGFDALSSPLNLGTGRGLDTTLKFATEVIKLRLRGSLGETINNLITKRYIFDVQLLPQQFISNEVDINFYVLGTRLKN